MKKIMAFIIASCLCVTALAAGDGTGINIYFSTCSIFEGIPTEGIAVPRKASVIYVDSGELSHNIGAVKLPVNSTDGRLAYSSDNPHISVDENGNITSDGDVCSANITIVCGGVSIVYPVYAIHSIRRFALSESKLEMYADRSEPIRLSAVCDPSELDTSAIEWYSGDDSIAYVDETGLVIPNGVGTTSVYAATPDGERTAKCTVYVGLYDVTLKAVFITNAIDKIKQGTAYNLSAYLYPENVSDKTLNWSSSDSTVVSVDGDSVLHAAEPGYAVITAEAANGKSDSFEIEVVPQTDNNFEYHVISKSVSERLAEFYTKPQFKSYGYTLNDMTDVQMAREPVVYAENREAETGEVRKALDPASNASTTGKYQFIDLSQSNNVDVDTLNRYLAGKGVLEGRGQQFKEAAERYGLSELYLVTHAALESGSGYSRLARGIEVDGTVVYNLFGIGAFDANANRYGSEYAYQMGWVSVDAAIEGGARWISENYINNLSYHQNTLYKMRWNPDSPGEHQYATDINWAREQAATLKSMFDAFPNAELHYEIPLYKGEKEFELK